MQNLERELTETRALLAEVRECVQKAKNDVEFVLKMIRGAAATLEKDCMEDSELPEEPEEPATAMPEQPKQRVLPEKCSVKRKMS
ncbi:uncharacterized protein DMAD_00042 [Drosophila madeirensis]|uniref:Uncharacterized protein n=1 Tax=Drosophila madeirensis TaxID=30013 RepID=A0AAU9FWS5_DROMD